MKKAICKVLAFIFAFSPRIFAFAAEKSEIEALRGTKLYVYNWGEYISDGAKGSMDVNAEFEKKYGIKVIYDTYANNEVMYSKLKGGGVSYDVVVPSDYMIERMIKEGMLEKLDFSNIPNFKYIDGRYKNLAHDPTNEYSVPYTVGMVGLIYNSKLVAEPPESWTALWDERYSHKIVMIDNPRDAFAIAQSVLGMDFNAESPVAWRVAADLLKAQKSVYPSYLNDEVFLTMESGEAALAPYFAGDFLSMKQNNPDLDFVYPKEGVNFFVDAACALKGAKNKLAAELYINFLLEPDVALANAEYICYASPHTGVYRNPNYSFYMNDILYPEAGKFKTQLFQNLSPKTLALMSELWDDVKNCAPSSGGPKTYEFYLEGVSGSDGEPDVDSDANYAESRKYAICIGVFLAACLAYAAFIFIRKKYRESA